MFRIVSEKVKQISAFLLESVLYTHSSFIAVLALDYMLIPLTVYVYHRSTDTTLDHGCCLFIARIKIGAHGIGLF